MEARTLRVEFLTPALADGPIAIWARDRVGREYMVAREIAVGVWERD